MHTQQLGEMNDTVVSAALNVTGHTGGALASATCKTLEVESRFYRNYSWSVQVFPKLREVVRLLGLELTRITNGHEEWQRREVATNIFLFSCAVTECIDDFMLGRAWDFSKAAVSLLRIPLCTLELLNRKYRANRERRLKELVRWREAWNRALCAFSQVLLNQGRGASTLDHSSIGELQSLLKGPFPSTLFDARPRIPAAFHAQDLTPFDIAKLGEKFVELTPDRMRPILVVGLRTAGSYFAPLLVAYLRSEGYKQLDSVTIRPKSGVGYWEMRHLKRAARNGATAVVIDEPGATGSTYARAVDYLRFAGLLDKNIVVLIPVHPAVRNWRDKPGYLRLSRVRMLSLEPEEYYKHALLQPQVAQEYLSAYFRAWGYTDVRVMESTRSDQINGYLTSLSEEKSQNRFKRVFEVHLRQGSGNREVRLVMAKSVGWGWLSYHAFLAGENLSKFVPPVIGLRDGLLYSEWITTSGNQSGSTQRERIIETAASYIATRVKKLPLVDDATKDLSHEGRHFGTETCAEYFSRAYGGRALAGLRRARVRHDLAEYSSPYPTFIDGRMRRLEWVERGDTIFKSDFEQHGLGKFELSITDPAYDIAETILHFALTPTEEHELLRRYTIYTGDLSIRKRLFLNKIRAGTWAMNVALSILNDSRLVHRHAEFHQLFTEAWLFLTFLAARRCGELCKPNHDVEWRSPLVILDVDGVLDRHVLGFPSTTQAGIRALSLLHSHGITVAVNTARTTEEVKEYCRAYGFAGGVAEYGAWAWDAITGNEVVLVNQKDLEQLDELAQELRKIPGVFMNDRCRYSVRAYMYVPTGTVPVPRPVIETLMSRLKVDRLKLHQTSLDTAITARTVDKGKGLVALKEIVGQTTAETASVGDTESDLSMFAVSDRSYAPKNMVSCWSIAKSMGCQRVSGTCQVGLLQIAQAVAHKKGVRCHHCSAVSGKWGDEPDLFLDLLRIADHSRISRLLGALLDPLSFRAFVK